MHGTSFAKTLDFGNFAQTNTKQNEPSVDITRRFAANIKTTMTTVDLVKNDNYNILVQQIAESVASSLNLDNGIRHMQNELPLTVTVDEAARLLNISLPTAYELTKRRDFPAFRIGKKVLVSRSGLQAWIDEQCQGE